MTSDNRLAFISYARRDTAFARPFAAYLRARGLSTWMDVENLREGEAWEEAVEAVLPRVSLYIACLSDSSVKSRWTSVEHERALALGLSILPVLIDGLSRAQAPDALRRLTPIDVSRHPSEDAAFRAAAAIADHYGMTPPPQMTFIARAIHERWRAAQDAGGNGLRWKSAPVGDLGWIERNAQSLGDRARVSSGGAEIDLQRLSFDELPPTFVAETTRAAEHVVGLLQASPGLSLEALAADVHIAWLQRNGEDAAPALAVAYAELSEHEKEKDRIIVRTAALALGLTLQTP